MQTEVGIPVRLVRNDVAMLLHVRGLDGARTQIISALLENGVQEGPRLEAGPDHERGQTALGEHVLARHRGQKTVNVRDFHPLLHGHQSGHQEAGKVQQGHVATHLVRIVLTLLVNHYDKNK